MVIETSAMVAIYRREPERERFISMILRAPIRLMLAMALYEAAVVLVEDDVELVIADLRALVADLEISVVPMDQTLAEEAVRTYGRFGKGRHPAKLNLGDCPSYALAKRLGLPLLYKGEDFAKTDIASAE